METTINIARLRTFKQAADECPAFKERALRYLYANRHTNGFGQCVVRIDGRVFINLDALSKWIEDKNPHRRKRAGEMP